MERTLKKAIRTASNVNSLMLLLFYGLIYAAVFGIQLLIPHLGFSDSIYYEAIYEVIVYFVQYVVVVPVLLLLFRAILGRKIGWNLKDSYRKPQASGGQLFRWCLIALGLVYATSMASQIFFNVVEMVTDVELQAPSMVAEENWVGYLNNIVAFSLYAPIFEEMLFRATLFRNTERFGSWFGVITIGITFGLWHCNYEQFFYTAVLGICAAFLTAKTRSVLPAMAIHFTMNFIGTMLSIAYSGLDTDNLDLEGMLQHPLKMLLLAGMNFLVIGILIAGCVLLYLNPGDHQLMMDLLLFLIVGPAVISPLMELVEFGAELRNLSVRMDQIDDVLKMEPTGEGQIDAVPACPALSFRDVSFSYQKAADPLRRMALDHVSMEIPAGSFVALVGPSGGGKSTAGQLLARFWDVESGSIAIGGTDIRDYTARTLMDTVAFVFQDTYIFAESVYDNIAMHRDVGREAVEQAARAARCHEFILSLPDGYNTRLGDGGHKLSGGEAQRIAIARAILKDAPIVVLDEAMAFADAENELALREGMAELLRGKTVLMIAHRLYSIRDADCIYVLDSGRLAESGTHQELLDKNGLYAHLWAVQNETEVWQMKGGRFPCLT